MANLEINPISFKWMNEWYPSSMGFTAIYQHYGNQNKSIWGSINIIEKSLSSSSTKRESVLSAWHLHSTSLFAQVLKRRRKKLSVVTIFVGHFGLIVWSWVHFGGAPTYQTVWLYSLLHLEIFYLAEMFWAILIANVVISQLKWEKRYPTGIVPILKY